jgi:tetratricopeptide (TPR) repeat protein
LALAARLADNGETEAAEAIYRVLLAADPDDLAALHVCGLLMLRLNRLEEAAALLAQAAALAPDPAMINLQLSVTLISLGRHEAALAALDRVLTLVAGHEQASNLRGITLMALRRLPEALTSFARAVALRPDFADALYNQGTALLGLGHNAAAVESFDRALALRPDHADALLNRGNALLGLERLEDGLASYRAAQALMPDHRELNINIGTALQALGRHAEALASFEAALVLAPDLPGAHNGRGNALIALDRTEEAVAAYVRAVALDPLHAEACYNRANALMKLDRLEDALASYDRGLALRAGFGDAWVNRGVCLHRLRRPAEAAEDFARAQAADPAHAQAHWNESLSRLTLGDFATGWRKYEWRWAMPEMQSTRRLFDAPLWLGETPLDGRTLLVHVEQGFGDTLQFCRYLTLLSAEAQIVFVVQPALVRLMRSLPRAVTLVSLGDTVPSFDLQCPLLSLPLACGTTLDTIPAPVPYLHAEPAAVAPWRQRLAALPGKRVGLCWAGDPRPHQPDATAIDRRRSIPLAAFAPLGGVPGISLVSLQKGAASVQARMTPPAMSLHDWTDALDDFADTAALVAALDLVITADTAVAHLAGALGKPVWILNRYEACWRWLMERTDSPWYPSARLFHQAEPGDWDSVIADVVAALRAFVA